MQTVLYIIFAAVGLGFLVFIHEWGHYWMARRVGMKVEIFSIGFGKPMAKWEHKGVRWQICWLPFGGYVKICGMEVGRGGREMTEEEKEHGFFSKKPIDRIKVLLAGPVVNLIFALLAFSTIWFCGGRNKPFAEFTQRIGWVDTESELYVKGVRPGDSFTAYDGHPYQNAKDLLYAGMLSSNQVRVQGEFIDEMNGQKTAYDYTVAPYPYPGMKEGIKTIGILNPARYLIYDRFSNGSDNALPEGSPLVNSGLQYGDRIVWLNGDLIYSLEQLSSLLNSHKTLLTVQRGDQTLLIRSPRVKIGDLRLDVEQRAELSDWQHELGLRAKLPYLNFIPYNITSQCVVESTLPFIDPDAKDIIFPKIPMSSTLDTVLQPGDRILAVNGQKIYHSRHLLAEMQNEKAFIIVQRGNAWNEMVNWKVADQQFDQLIEQGSISSIAQSIGTDHLVDHQNAFYLLKPVTPKTILDFDMTPQQKAELNSMLLAQKKEIEKISDPEKRQMAAQAFEESQNKLLLGAYLQDRKVVYNPSPLALFGSICEEAWRTVAALFSGYLSPKWFSGPVGIVQVMQHGWMIGPLEALFWMGAISLNLGVLNLLPIPVLDGGYIVLSLMEMITGRALKAKTVEKLILPFMILFFAFLIFVTYHDLLRLF